MRLGRAEFRPAAGGLRLAGRSRRMELAAKSSIKMVKTMGGSIPQQAASRKLEGMFGGDQSGGTMYVTIISSSAAWILRKSSGQYVLAITRDSYVRQHGT